MKIINLLFIGAIFCQELLATAISPKDIVSQDLLTELLSTGKTRSKILDLSQNKKFFVEAPGIRPTEKYYQPFEIKEGCLLSTEYMANERGEKQNFVSTLIQATLRKIAFEQIIASKVLTFPKFPIIFRTLEKENLSFVHLIYVWEVLTNELGNSVKYAFESDYKKFASYIFQNYTKAIFDIPDFFQKCYDSGIFQAITNSSESLDFIYEKEEFFSIIRFFIEMQREKINEDEFLNLIYALDYQLNETFFSKCPKELLPEDKIYKGLTHSCEVVRDTYAKALLLYVFMYPNKLEHLELIRNQILCLTQKYGQAARWLHHLTPDNEFTHIFTAEEYAATNHTSFRKSFWVLKQGFTYVDFYKTLLLRLKFGQAAFNVNHVEINQKDGYQNIVIDIESKKEQLNRVVSEMKTLDKSRNMIDANGIRFVIRKPKGYFDLITAYPVFLDSISSAIKPTGSLITRLKDFIDLSKFPEFSSIALELD